MKPLVITKADTPEFERLLEEFNTLNDTIGQVAKEIANTKPYPFEKFGQLEELREQQYVVFEKMRSLDSSAG